MIYLQFVSKPPDFEQAVPVIFIDAGLPEFSTSRHPGHPFRTALRRVAPNAGADSHEDYGMLVGEGEVVLVAVQTGDSWG